jgi:hypothetical protein
MQQRPQNPANGRWWAAVFVALVVAVVVVRFFRPPPQADKPEKNEAADVSLVSTQVLSFQLDTKAELDSVADDSGSLFMQFRPERPGTAIVHSDPSPANMETYQRERDVSPSDRPADLNRPREKIEVE